MSRAAGTPDRTAIGERGERGCGYFSWILGPVSNEHRILNAMWCECRPGRPDRERPAPRSMGNSSTAGGSSDQLRGFAPAEDISLHGGGRRPSHDEEKIGALGRARRRERLAGS